ncbi:hypothetical protein AC1031_018105 [Aphanomyces cochlioides]|nr:hypothetical protein AC1031_018105 [Aphanomyces cochlioides]
MSEVRELMCVAVGHGEPFRVKIPAKEPVSALKEEIAPQIGYRGLVKDLLLYQALKNKVWLKCDDNDMKCLSEGTKDNHVLSDYVNENPPKAGRIHVVVVTPNEVVKPPDIIENFDEQWLRGIVQCSGDLPNVSELEKIASGSLRIRIPVDDPVGLFANIAAQTPPPELIAQVFEESTGKHCPIVMQRLKEVLFREIPVGSTESSYIHYWDNIISDTLYFLFRDIGAKINRNTNNSSSTSTFRPDYIFLLFNVCVFRGEEKMEGVDAELPRKELIDKLQWTYDPAPYIFGYAACGFYLCLYAIEPICVKNEQERSDKKPRVPSCQTHLLGRFILDTYRGRLELFRSLVNISQFLKKIADLCPRPADNIFLDKKRITFEVRNGESIVKKTFPSSEASWRIEHLKLIYNEMEQHEVPNIDHLIDTGRKYILLSPVGECISEDEKRIPKNVTELLQALVSVLEALVVLHSIGWMHRDIRWANVVKKNNSSKWFLMDFDDAAKSPKQNNPDEHLTRQEHTPEIFEDGSHTTSVDIWAVGNLILSSQLNQSRSKVLDDFGLRLVDANPEKRPKAGEVLKTIKAMLDEKKY